MNLPFEEYESVFINQARGKIVPSCCCNRLNYQPLITLVYFIPENTQLYNSLLNCLLARGLGLYF